MRFDGEVPVGRLDKELATHTFYLQKDLSLDVPITDMLQKRIAIDDVHRPVGKGQVSCIGHDERYDVGLSTHITGHNVKSDDPVPNTKPEQLIFKLPIAIPNIKYSLSLSLDKRLDEELQPSFTKAISTRHEVSMPPTQQLADEPRYRIHSDRIASP